MYRGNEDESYIETRVRLYVHQHIGSKSTLTIPPDEDSCTQLLYRAHYQAYMWNMCMRWSIPHIDYLQNGWKKSADMLVPLWFTEPQFPPSVTKKKYDGYDADDEKSRKRKDTSSSRGRMFRKKLNTSSMINTNCGLNDERNDEMEIMVSSSSIFEKESDWEHFSEFSESLESSDSDWM